MAKKNFRRKEDFVSKSYDDMFSYLGKNKRYIYSILIIFTISFFIGYFFPIFFVEEIKEFIKILLVQTEGLGGFALVGFIFKNNILVSLSSILFGLFFGIIPIFTCIVNGYVLGFVASFAVSQEGILVLWKLFPHGIFEIPAVIISLALGLKLGLFIFNKNFKKEFKSELKNMALVFIFVIFPLLVIAAIIEGILVGLAA